MNGVVEEGDAMQALMGLVQQTDAETVNRVNNYADPAERRKAMSGEFEDNSVVSRTNLKNYMMQSKDLNADRHMSQEEMRMAAATAMSAKGSVGFGGFIPENEFQGQPQMQMLQQGGIPYAPAPYQQTQPSVVQNLQMPAPATKAIVDALASIANNLPPALRGLYEKQNELLKEVKRTNDLFIAFLKAYASQASKPAAKQEKASDNMAEDTAVAEEKA
jgi:hypothetical protein